MSGSRLKARGSSSEERLLGVALDAFLKDGLTATIDSISAEAKISKRTIYAQYRDKRELFIAAVLRVLDKSAKNELVLDTSLPLDEILCGLARRSMEVGFAPAIVKLHRITLRVAEDFPELMEHVINEPEVDFVRPLAAHLDHLAAQGEIRQVNTTLVARSFLGTVFRELTVRVMRRASKPDEHEVDEWANALADLYVHGLEWRTPAKRRRAASVRPRSS